MSGFNIENIEVDNWHDLRYRINRYFSHWDSYIFRGHGQDDWLLESTLSRALKKVEAKNKRDLVATQFNRFKLEIRGKRGDNPRQLSDDEVWALGQHYGLYTPLLDWTESPWVAIFFSLISIEKSETGKRALWALHVEDIKFINEAYKKKSNNVKNLVELLQPDIDENRRLVNQKALFTKIDIENDVEKWVRNAPKIGNWITLYKIVFPDSLRQKMLLYLNLMNINFASLFPDIDGSSRHINSKLLLTDYIQKRKDMDWEDNLDDEE